MFKRQVYTSPIAPKIEIHVKGSERAFTIYEDGVQINDSDAKVPDGMAVEQYIEGFFAGVQYANGELRKIRLSDNRL